MTPEIAEAVDEADRAACIALRIAVFCGEQGVTRDEEIDGLDETARHLLARVAGRPATCLWRCVCASMTGSGARATISASTFPSP